MASISGEIYADLNIFIILLFLALDGISWNMNNFYANGVKKYSLLWRLIITTCYETIDCTKSKPKWQINHNTVLMVSLYQPSNFVYRWGGKFVYSSFSLENFYILRISQSIVKFYSFTLESFILILFKTLLWSDQLVYFCRL